MHPVHAPPLRMPANQRIPILLTSSVVAYDTGVSLRDTEERVRLALESVREWLKLDPTLPIVLCDGSNHDFSEAVREHFPDATIECLPFSNNQELVRQYGRGYGEGEIVRYALNNSSLIAEAGCFAKCTSKLWVANFRECAATWNNRLLLKGVFLHVFSPFRPTEFSYIDTRFYIASCALYRQYFEYAHHHIRKNDGHGLEECFRDIFLANSLGRVLLAVPPVICGVGGGTGTYYKNPVKRRLKERLRLWLVRRSRRFAGSFQNI